jgi:hypothetical protein
MEHSFLPKSDELQLINHACLEGFFSEEETDTFSPFTNYIILTLILEKATLFSAKDVAYV